ncbi:uncharacterized protein B0T15DRAFT_506482 [Chaetomium strumarium]|uniref:Uncharacterized protein n=1 Tax=Chaetomium strumarium TaxID=1170767 RepID=A0AAJ0M5L5_9PEZI|nr:hypothetical protein B0T15DRAFT_506482 [Chaetomium strumarium]
MGRRPQIGGSQSVEQARFVGVSLQSVKNRRPPDLGPLQPATSQVREEIQPEPLILVAIGTAVRDDEETPTENDSWRGNQQQYSQWQWWKKEEEGSEGTNSPPSHLPEILRIQGQHAVLGKQMSLSYSLYDTRQNGFLFLQAALPAGRNAARLDMRQWDGAWEETKWYDTRSTGSIVLPTEANQGFQVDFPDIPGAIHNYLVAVVNESGLALMLRNGQGSVVGIDFVYRSGIWV